MGDYLCTDCVGEGGGVRADHVHCDGGSRGPLGCEQRLLNPAAQRRLREGHRS